MVNKSTVKLMDYDENWIKQNNYKLCNTLNNIGNQETKWVQVYLHQIWKLLARLLTVILQWHDGAPKAILKTACLFVEIIDSDIIQVPSKGQFQGQSQDEFCNCCNFTFCWQRALSQRRHCPEKNHFLYVIIVINKLIGKMTTPLFISRF